MRVFTEEEKNYIDNAYIDGVTIEGIRSHLHCKETTLKNYLKDNGYKKRKRNEINGKESLSLSRKYFFDEHYFNIIDNEEKAYWLGFLYADGNVSYGKDKNGNQKGCTIELSLGERDINHLKKLLNALNASQDYPIMKRIVKLNDKQFTAYRVCFNSVIMGADLINHGCVPNKSLILTRPVLSKDLIRHFIRGYFDGDGCVSYNNDTHEFIYNMLGTFDILSFIKEQNSIFQNISIRQPKRNGNFLDFYSFSIGGRDGAILFHKYLYLNSNIYLDRKYEKSCELYNYLCSLKNIA